MKRVLTAAVLIPVIILVLFKAPVWLFGIVAMAFALISVWEYLTIADLYGASTFKAFSMSAVGMLFVLEAVRHMPAGFTDIQALQVKSALGFAIIGLTAAVPLLCFAIGMARSDHADGVRSAVLSAFAIPYVALPILSLASTRAVDHGAFLILYLFVVVWSGDIFAYYVGKTFGRHKLALRISPNKTWEGAFASFVTSVCLGALMLYFRDDITLSWPALFPPPHSAGGIPNHGWLAVLISALINIAAQLGDLAESMLKRGAGVKDSGVLLPGHGGMLDRIDALLFAAPIVWIYAMIDTSMRSYLLPYPNLVR
jgi:phosphatidate cytidylyltransferase